VRSPTGRRGELGRQFSEGWTYLAAWLVAVAIVCWVVGLIQPREGGGGDVGRTEDGIPGARSTSVGDGAAYVPGGGRSRGHGLAAAALASCDGERSDGVVQGRKGRWRELAAAGPRGRGAGMDDVGEQATKIRTALTVTVCAEKLKNQRVNWAKFSLWLRGAY
jgi:hypothetical protein